MAAYIVEKGTVSPTKSKRRLNRQYEKKCPNCGARFRYKYRDLEGNWARDCMVINCPQCKEILDHNLWNSKRIR